MKQQHIVIEKTARYFSLGEPSKTVDTVWFVCHGYGQLANKFLEKFQSLDDGKTLVIAPEGLHRFYWDKFTGPVVASWMTKEDRLHDIKDYVNFLDAVYNEVLSDLNTNVKVNVLGFSQGCATTCRWICQGKAMADNFILWAGAIPPDMNFDVDVKVFNAMNTWVVIGDNDRFIEIARINEYENELKNKGINYQLLKFKGGHEILDQPLLSLAKQV